ncbi:hypothetical protein [Flavobacterium ginsenosidimutans]|uniref:Uncharacterized protein n=1 Tax=Flavobacterium ginsenosidimutans TaxID=687844 RepID=A0ABZ2Q9N0_9FLAO
MQSLDQISIQLKVFAFIDKPDDVGMQGELEIFINGEKPYDNGEIVDIPIFLDSLKSNGDFYIFCCHCGLPECNGRTEGVKVFHEKDTIKWIDTFCNKTWYFDKNKIETDLKNINEEILVFKKYFAEKQIEYFGFGHDL